MKKLKIGFFGDGVWAHNSLRMLLSDKASEVMFVCIRFASPDLQLKSIAESGNIPVISSENINSFEFLSLLKKFECDIYVSMSFNQIFTESLFKAPPLGAINCHAGKLPFYRGRNVLNWALINDEKSFGITVHYIDSGIDTGDIISQAAYPINDSDTYKTLLEVAHKECAVVLMEALDKIRLANFSPIKQDQIHPLGFYCSMRKLGDERINWRLSSREIFNFIRAISSPGPNARTTLREAEVQIISASLIAGAINFKGIPGAILHVGNDEFDVKTGDSHIRVLKWCGVNSLRIGDRFL